MEKATDDQQIRAEEKYAANHITTQKNFRDKLIEANIKLDCKPYFIDKTSETKDSSSNTKLSVVLKKEQKNIDLIIHKLQSAKILYEKKQFNDAKKEFRDVETMQKDVLGEKHVDTFTTKHWIARCLYKKKQFDNAEEMFNDAENLQKAILGVKHPNILLTIYWIARCLRKNNSITLKKCLDI